MIRHMLMFRLRDEADAAECDSMLAELASFPQRYPSMQNFALGRNASRRDDRFTHAMTIEFGTWSELDSYLSSAAHEAFVTERFRPLVAERAIASFDDGAVPQARSASA